MKKISLTLIAIIVIIQFPFARPWTISGSNIYYNTGSAGIGSTAPRSNLEVSSGANIGATIITSNNGFAGSVAAPLYLRNDFMAYNNAACGIDGRIEFRDRSSNYAGSDMTFWLRNNAFTLTQVMFLDKQTGNVLINKTSQANTTYKLDVNGNVRVNQIVVNTNGGDFVFDPGYKLIALLDLEKYIAYNHHLPEIPSAPQMQKEGLNVGEKPGKTPAKDRRVDALFNKQE